MPKLEKAYLVELTTGKNPTEKNATKVNVQFNPTTMRLQMSNNIEGGKARPRQVQQFTGQSSTTLTLDLVFDTADRLTNVRDKTLKVVKFVMPSSQSKQAPPPVRFKWGHFQFDGVMSGITEDVDLFSPEGIPLRSKLSISIKEQDSKFAALQSGAGAKTGSAATPPGDSTKVAGPGSTGGGPTDSTASAQAGESAADFAARMGLDPSAWRGIAAGMSNPLSLEGGAQIDFNSNLSVSAGIGASAQLQAGASLDLNAAAGLQLAAGATGQATAQAGFALSASGGVTAATQAVDVARTESAAAQARAAFGVPPPTTGAAAGPALARTMGAGSVPAATASAVAARSISGIDPSNAAAPPDRTPLKQAPAQVVFPDAPAPAPPPPRSDPRAVSFGFGIPLRPRITGAAEDRPGADGWVRVGARPRSVNPPQVVDPTAFPWLALPAVAPDRAAADAAQISQSGRAFCGCGSPTGGSGACACGGFR
jgi:contractile injection system tube protein